MDALETGGLLGGIAIVLTALHHYGVKPVVYVRHQLNRWKLRGITAEQRDCCEALLKQNRKVWEAFIALKESGPQSDLLKEPVQSHVWSNPPLTDKERSTQQMLWDYRHALSRAGEVFEWPRELMGKFVLLHVQYGGDRFIAGFEEHANVLAWIMETDVLWNERGKETVLQKRHNLPGEDK